METFLDFKVSVVNYFGLTNAQSIINTRYPTGRVLYGKKLIVKLIMILFTEGIEVGQRSPDFRWEAELNRQL